MNKPLVSILIPAYNAERWIAETIQSALAQTWPHKEIIVVDDGSRDRTAEIADSFAPAVKVVSKQNSGAAATRNEAMRLSQGEYIQWLDADDLLSPGKIELQLDALNGSHNPRVLLSCPWAPFYYRTKECKFINNSLCADLTPAEWLVRKMRDNFHMQTATWLTSRTLADAAGAWDTRLLSDDDGEYFCRVLLAAESTVFVPDAHVYYRISPAGRLSRVGQSDRKKEALLISMKLHVQYLLSLEDSDQARHACLTYLQTWFGVFYPERPDLVKELQYLASELGGKLVPPSFSWKYAWLRSCFGWGAAKWAQDVLPRFRTDCQRQVDKMLYSLNW